MVKGLDYPGRKPVLDWRLRGQSVAPEQVPDDVAGVLIKSLQDDERLRSLSNEQLAGPGCNLWFRKQELSPTVTEYILRYEQEHGAGPRSWVITSEFRNGQIGEPVIRESPK